MKPLRLTIVSASVLAILFATGCQQQADNLPAATSEPEAPKVAMPEPQPLPLLPAFSVADIDTAANACADLNAFVNGKWLAANPVPADRTTWGSFEMLGEHSLVVQRNIVEKAAATPNASGIEKLIGDIWATGMDEAAIEAKGLSPIQTMLDEITALKTPEQIAGYLQTSNARGQGFVFGFGPSPDFKNSSMVIAYAGQAGLGLPDKTYYFDAKHKEKLDAYVTHISKVLELGGASKEQADQQAKQVIAFETALAEASNSTEELSRDVSLYYNPVSVAKADQQTPNFSWKAFFDAQGLAAPEMFSLAQPKFFGKLDELIKTAPIEQWQAYLRFHTIDRASPALSKAFADQNYNFYGKTLRGQQEQKPRWKRVLDSVNGGVGEALGQLYVAQAFPAESKAQMQELVQNLRDALKIRLEKLDWMSAETKAKAMEKWASFTPKIGYPDKWRDWSGLDTKRASYVENLIAMQQFNYQYELSKIGKPVDRTEWGMTPQTVNAYYNPLMNEIVFPAAILQPPFFDPKADPALNYGGIGAVIGHEMIHGYDDQGSRFDATGNFANWWSESDLQGFQSRTKRLVDQFNQYVALEDLKVNGNLTLGENIADLGGLNVAYDALQAALAKQKVEPIDGFSQDQRFFMNWATVWRRNFTAEELKVRLTTDSHAPAKFRAIGAPSNMNTFATAFSCKAEDAMVRDGKDQIAIW